MPTINKEILERVESGKLGFHDPCVICGVSFIDCPHTVEDTEPVIRQARRMSKSARDLTRKGMWPA